MTKPRDELDFIINYDIKYRMGRDAGNGEMVVIYRVLHRKDAYK